MNDGGSAVRRSCAPSSPRSDPPVDRIDIRDIGSPAGPPQETSREQPWGVGVDFKNSRAKQFNAFVEKQMGENVVTVGYMGSRADRLQTAININMPPPGPGSIDPRRPFYSQFPLLTTIQVRDGAALEKATRTYNAFQVMLRRNYTCGLTVTTHYTWGQAKSCGFASWDRATLWVQDRCGCGVIDLGVGRVGFGPRDRRHRRPRPDAQSRAVRDAFRSEGCQVDVVGDASLPSGPPRR
jgi:hypothetical protein